MNVLPDHVNTNINKRHTHGRSSLRQVVILIWTDKFFFNYKSQSLLFTCCRGSSSRERLLNVAGNLVRHCNLGQPSRTGQRITDFDILLNNKLLYRDVETPQQFDGAHPGCGRSLDHQHRRGGMHKQVRRDTVRKKKTKGQ